MNTKQTNKIYLKKDVEDKTWNKINQHCKNQSVSDINSIVDWLVKKFNIDITLDQDIISGYISDYSNMKGRAIGLFRPKNDREASIVIRVFYLIKMPYTISAGKTNLTGSATPMEGFVLSIENLNQIKPFVKDDTITCSTATYLEDMRIEVLAQSKGKYYYPVDPTSRKEAMVGGTISCNASGFVPGFKGATRHWVNGLKVIMPNGYYVDCKRGEYISCDSKFFLNEKELVLPKYKRPKIKNASGPYTCYDEEIDFIDFMVGSEGLFGLMTMCSFNLDVKPKNFLDFFIVLDSEDYAIKFYDYLSKVLDGELSKLNALEYFGYNSQKYLKNKEYFFKNENDVGIYLQIPLYNKSVEEGCEFWFNILSKSKCNVELDKIFVLNDKKSWDLFFEARHSMPELAFQETKKVDGISVITDTIVPNENFKESLFKIHKVIRDAKIEYLLFGHLGDCHLHFHLIPGKNQQEKAFGVYNEIVKISSNLGGVYSAEHGTGKRKKSDFLNCYGMQAANELKISKLCLDPDMILNRGNIID
ncbi:MAG: hypothetical protein CMG00_08850 [Candidatus Marinimicrobia bacterium]|nr:hypothetical protein [Candidatus Neomarinimicrobiota bacterium]